MNNAARMKIIASMMLLGALQAGLASSCARAPDPSPPATAIPTHIEAPPTATTTAPPTASPTSVPNPAASQISPAPVFQACSPLQGFPLDGLSAAVVNPYNPPPLGSDDPHQGVDLAQVQNGISLTGLSVQAVLEGQVALVVSGRFPYGNALLVETPLDSLPPGWLEKLDLPPAPAEPQASNALTCPTPAAPPEWEPERSSLYLLYAHMLEPPALQAGDSVSCGQVIGAIGSSGNALNPHLHLEVRVGPSGARFPAWRTTMPVPNPKRCLPTASGG